MFDYPTTQAWPPKALRCLGSGSGLSTCFRVWAHFLGWGLGYRSTYGSWLLFGFVEWEVLAISQGSFSSSFASARLLSLCCDSFACYATDGGGGDVINATIVCIP